MKKNNISIGTWMTINNSIVAEILCDAGFDWVCIDIEHTTTSLKDVQVLILAIQSKNKKAFVRVGGNNEIIIKRVLDAGADGIIVPMINSYMEAEKAVENVKYPPLGKRGVGLFRAQGYGFNFDNYKNKISKKIKLIVQIEHYKAIDDLEKILNVEGIDGTFIGPFDLSGSLGKPGKWNDEDVKKYLKKYDEITSKSNKLKGFHVIEPSHKIVNEKIKLGYNFIAFSLDTLFLGTIANSELKKLKS